MAGAFVLSVPAWEAQPEVEAVPGTFVWEAYVSPSSRVDFGAHLRCFIFLLFNLKGNMFSNFRHILLMAHHSWWSLVMAVRGTEPPLPL